MAGGSGRRWGDLLQWARQQVADRVPRADLDQRDPDYIREQLPGTWLLASLYFRADVRGLDRIPPTGPVLLVGNHWAYPTCPLKAGGSPSSGPWTSMAPALE